ncbi:MAG: DUF711 family protein [Anaerolineaceae bacterium]|nr:DUF711 family protein [Anaerolineaceae bacterium]
MRIRSITIFLHPRWPISELALQKAGIFAEHTQKVLQETGFEVQTVRLATPPWHEWLIPDDYAQMVTRLGFLAHAEGFEYIALGPASPDKLESYAAIPELLPQSSNAFFSGHLTTPDGQISLPAVKACAEVIHRSAPLEKNGFANLRFAALANVPPWAPFFPAAYHLGKSPAFALAIEGADLAVEAFGNASSLAEARSKLIETIQGHAAILEEKCNSLAAMFQFEFKGLDFTLAPFPGQAASIGAALEALGLPAFGLSGSLAASAFLTDTLDRVAVKRTGFNGLMLPLLEDSTLAARGADGSLSLTDLLLFSSVCGTGLDTLPLPGDTSVEQLQAILLDLAALALRLNKPLTARLMPILGKQAGEPTGFNFEYFANSKVLEVPARPLSGLLNGDENLEIKPRQR